MRALYTAKFTRQLDATRQRAAGFSQEAFPAAAKPPVLVASGEEVREQTRNLWQARTNDDRRFYFTIEGDVYILRTIRSHPK